MASVPRESTTDAATSSGSGTLPHVRSSRAPQAAAAPATAAADDDASPFFLIAAVAVATPSAVAARGDPAAPASSSKRKRGSSDAVGETLAASTSASSRDAPTTSTRRSRRAPQADAATATATAAAAAPSSLTAAAAAATPSAVATRGDPAAPASSLKRKRMPSDSALSLAAPAASATAAAAAAAATPSAARDVSTRLSNAVSTQLSNPSSMSLADFDVAAASSPTLQALAVELREATVESVKDAVLLRGKDAGGEESCVVFVTVVYVTATIASQTRRIPLSYFYPLAFTELPPGNHTKVAKWVLEQGRAQCKRCKGTPVKAASASSASASAASTSAAAASSRGASASAGGGTCTHHAPPDEAKAGAGFWRPQYVIEPDDVVRGVSFITPPVGSTEYVKGKVVMRLVWDVTLTRASCDWRVAPPSLSGNVAVQRYLRKLGDSLSLFNAASTPLLDITKEELREVLGQQPV